MKPNTIILIAIISHGVLIFALIYSLIKINKPKPYPIGFEINNLVIKNKNKWIKFYDKFLKNKVITSIIIDNALSAEIPLHYFIAVCYVESRFNPKAVGKRNKNGSYDYGLFQLNSSVYKNYSKKELMKIRTNIYLAANHLRNNKKRFGNWYEAIIRYNGNIQKKTVLYLKNVLDYTNFLNKEIRKKL